MTNEPNAPKVIDLSTLLQAPGCFVNQVYVQTYPAEVYVQTYPSYARVIFLEQVGEVQFVRVSVACPFETLTALRDVLVKLCATPPPARH